MKIELGGGVKPRGEGFVNYDVLPCADVVCDLSEGIPLDDDSVDEVYSSHCLEHIPDPMAVLREICRVCKVGGTTEIRVPHANSQLAMVWDHKHVFSEVAVMNFDEHFPHEFWTGPKRLKLVRTEYGCQEPLFSEACKLFPRLSHEQVLRFIPGTCHECHFHFVTQANG